MMDTNSLITFVIYVVSIMIGLKHNEVLDIPTETG